MSVDPVMAGCAVTNIQISLALMCAFDPTTFEIKQQVGYSKTSAVKTGSSTSFRSILLSAASLEFSYEPLALSLSLVKGVSRPPVIWTAPIASSFEASYQPVPRRNSKHQIVLKCCT